MSQRITLKTGLRMGQGRMGKEKDQLLPWSEMSPGRRPRGMLKRESAMTNNPATSRMEPARTRMRPRSGIGGGVALRTFDSIAQQYISNSFPLVNSQE